ncbi:cell division ATP-binding protein FtsE [Gilvimarinus sp. SDUM040013]|uniref:Cell division ATP-binding protein FtsE n=1 Tax=Gilvimarinus gilvus TaxID=3058038 RepID=A0ABU4S122_9GAMM|nr:cell division ATP-binding protein FtsE [Gilvimarinus sp. SDUM040013]MDO3387563.1 cell division ATP-binding protein FtsE [Gilvimarinus sp. SDUM040013]MDX6850172.1 cell division ATP-binding protein FtsE [Gilvimarinus sp. SDUM040013]
MIRFSGVSKRYATGQDALSRVDFHIDRGEMVFLTGHSGAGKSTLMKLIMLMERPTSGQVVVGGRNTERIRAKQIAHYRRDIGVVFQNHQLLFDRSVFDNIALPLQVAGFQNADIGRRVRAALDKVGLLHKERHNPITLSGGEQQRVGIARAVVNKPALVLADEPTGNLDPELSAEIMNLFRQFNELGMTLVIATHDIDLIERMNRRVLHLEQGRVVSGGGL